MKKGRTESPICFYCGRVPNRKTTKDHVIPVAAGGSNAKSNLVNACRDCNELKGRLSLNEFRVVMAFRSGALKAVEFVFPGEMSKP